MTELTGAPQPSQARIAMNWAAPSPTTGDEIQTNLGRSGMAGLLRLVRLVRAATALEVLAMLPPTDGSEWSPSDGSAGSEGEVVACLARKLRRHFTENFQIRLAGNKKAEAAAAESGGLSRMVRLMETARMAEEGRAVLEFERDILQCDFDELQRKPAAILATYPARRREIELARLAGMAVRVGHALKSAMGDQPFAERAVQMAIDVHREATDRAARSVTEVTGE